MAKHPVKLIVIGAGGHAKVVLDCLLRDKQFDVCGIVDSQKRKGEKLLGVPVLGRDKDLQTLRRSGISQCVIAVGSIGDCSARRAIAKRAAAAGFSFPAVVSGLSAVSRYALIGNGTFVAPHAIVNAGAEIGAQCIINTGAIVEHDCSIGEFSHLSPGCVLSGGVSIGTGTHIGTAATVIQGLSIGNNTVIGAGSVVTRDIPDNAVAFGNPCRIRRGSA